MPFITEEIYQKLPGIQGSIMVAPYPEADEALLNPAAEAEMNLLMETITAIRNLRGEMNVPPATQVDVFLQSPDAPAVEALQRHAQSLTHLAKVKDLTFNAGSGPPAAAAKSVVEAIEIYLPLAGIIDFSEEERRLTKEIDKLSKDLSGAQRKLTNEDFLAKAPPEVVAKEQDKVQGWTEKLTKLKNHRERIKELMG